MKCRRSIGVIAAAIAVIAINAAPVWADQATQIQMSAPAKAAKGHLTLRATLATAAGAPASEKTISFYEHVDLFGGRDALLGSATTDSTGYAAIDYQPVETGSQTITVRFIGDSQLAGSEVSSNIDIRDAAPVYTPEPLPLATVRQWLPLGLASLVLATWVVLLGVAVRTIRGIRSVRADEGRIS
jgi:hypothetical protein